MIDLIQGLPAALNVTEVEASFVGLTEQTTGSSEDSALFVSIMEQALVDENSLVPMEAPQVLIEEKISIPIKEEPVLEEHKDLDSLINDNASLAWFDAELFEPPSSTRPIEEEKVDEPPELLPMNIPISTQAQPVKEFSSTREEPLEDQVEQSPSFTSLQAPKREINQPVKTNFLELLGGDSEQEDSFILANKLDLQEARAPVPINLKTLIAEALQQPVDKPPEQMLKAPILVNIQEESGFVEDSVDELGEKIFDLSPLVSEEVTPTPLLAQTASITAANENGLITTKAIDLPQHLSNPEWSDDFNQQIIWLGQQKINNAVIKLNPQEFGPIEISIKMLNEETSISIMTHTTQVRDLVEQALPRLREMMTDQGLNLSQVTIESNENQRQSAKQQYEPLLNEAVSVEEPVEETVSIVKTSKGIIDYFA